MIPFGYPDNFEDAEPLLQGASVALLLMLPIVMGNGSYAGIFPRGREAVIRAIVRAVAVIALVYPIAGIMVPAPLVTIIGSGAGVLLLVMAAVLRSERGFCVMCSSMSVVLGVLHAYLYPVRG